VARNHCEDLRNHLFETLERLKDKDEPMDIERARAICEVSQQLINLAKAETQHARMLVDITGQEAKLGSDFFQTSKALPEAE